MLNVISEGKEFAEEEEKVVSRSDISCNEQGKQASCYFQGDI